MVEMTLKQILKTINNELKENFNRPIIKRESSYWWNSSYDTKNGRKLISDNDFKKILSKYGIIAHYCNKKYCVYGVDIKVKKRRSGVKDSWDGTERMTIVNAYCDNVEALEMTLSQLKQKEEN